MNILQFDKLHCKNCYKCVRHCSVKAIEVKNHRAQINAAESPDDDASVLVVCGASTAQAVPPKPRQEKGGQGANIDTIQANNRKEKPA